MNTLGCDIDGCCADFIGACALLEKRAGGDNIWPALRDVPNHPRWLEEILTGYQYDRKLYHALNPIPYAASTLRALASTVKIVYITARPMFARQATLLWLERHGFPTGMGFPVGKIVNVRNGNKVAAAKREKVDLFIEDRPLYANPLAEAGVKVVLLDIYDRSLGCLHENITVVSCWRAIARLLRKG